MKRYLILFNLILVAGIAYFGVQAGYRVAALALIGDSTPIPPSPRSRVQAGFERPLKDYQVVVDRNLFNTRGSAAPAEPDLDVGRLAPTALKLTLRGTVSGSNGQAYAVIEDDQQHRQQLYHQGDDIQGAVIRKILRGKVVLRVNGADEILAMTEPEDGIAEAPPVVEDATAPPGPVIVSDGQLRGIRSDLNNLAQQATIRPNFVEGKRDGFLMARVQPGSAFSQLGLRSGDIIKEVDGEALTSVAQALNFYQQLKPGSQIEVLISRQGVDQTLRYRIE